VDPEAPPEAGPARARATTDATRLVVALVLVAAFMAGEATAGFLAHSLALVSDAAHMLTDAAAIALSLVALRLAARPPAGGLTYGLKRAEILSALVNGTALLVLAIAIVVEAARRLATPPNPKGGTMLIVASIGVVVNLLATWQLARADQTSLNVRGVLAHVLTDLYAFIGTAIAAILIITAGVVRADPVASLLVAALMLRAAYLLITQAGRVLLEAAPQEMSIGDIRAALLDHDEVTDIHDLHVWEITSGFPSLSAHVLVLPDRDCHAVRRDLEATLGTRFGIEHTTLQVDHDERRRRLHINPKPKTGTGDPRRSS
jgi:cobalt-zinc-cadmium efflux system protein